MHRSRLCGWGEESAAIMELRVETHQSVDVLRLSGRLDLVSASALKDALRQRLADRRLQLVIDLDKVHFINSSGLGALISCLRDVRLAKGRLVLCRLAPYMEEIFAITTLNRVFECHASIADAIAAFAQSPQEAITVRS